MATVVIQKRIGKRGTAYAIRYKNPLSGSKKHYRTFRTYKEALTAANNLRSLLETGAIPDKKRLKLNPLTFEEVSTSLEKAWALDVRAGHLQQKTCYDYLSWLNGLKRAFASRLLCQISEEEITRLRDAKSELTTNISANRYLLVLRKMFEEGLKLGAVTDNPAKRVSLLSEKGYERKEYLVPQKLDRLIMAAQEGRARYYLPAMVLLAAEHGASRQEILSLKWSDIDFEYGGMGLIRLFRTKNSRERTQFLMPRTKEALLNWRGHLEWKRGRQKTAEVKSDHVFCRIDGRPLERFDKAWREARERAGLKGFHFHDLRHTFCSNLILSGAGLKEVKEMIGHKDISMTDRYAHLSLTHKLLVQKRLVEHYTNQPPSVSANPDL